MSQNNHSSFNASPSDRGDDGGHIVPPQMPVQPPSGLPLQQSVMRDQDTEHLKILSICYYVMSGLSLISAAVFVIYVVMGGMMMSGGWGIASGAASGAAELQAMGGIFLAIGLLGSVVIITLAVLEFLVARKLVRRESKVLCLVVAGINCLNMPIGTVLGVFTFLVLSRQSVAESFARNDKT